MKNKENRLKVLLTINQLDLQLDLPRAVYIAI